MLRVCSFLRLSSKKQAIRKGDEADIPTQRDTIARFMQDKPEWKLVGEYIEIDSAFRKGKADRDKLQDALRDAKERKYDILLLWKGDRLSRRIVDFPALVVDLNESGVQVWSVIDAPGGKWWTANNAMDVFMLSVEGFRNQSYSESISVNIKERKRQMAEAGQWLGTKVPYGYALVARKDDHGEPIMRGGRIDREPQVDPERAPIVREMFRRFIAGDGLVMVTRWLNESGIPAWRGGSWDHTQVARMLRNPFYIGYARYHGKVIKSNHPALIATEIWERAQEVSRARSVIPRRQRQHDYPLTGILFCGVCGERVGGLRATWSRGKPPVRAYRCRAPRRGQLCGNSIRKAEVVEESFVEALIREDGPSQLRQYLQEHDTDSRQIINDYHAMRKATTERLREVNGALSKLTREFLEGKSIFSPAEFAEWKANYTTEKDMLEGKLREPEPTISAVDWDAFALMVAQIPRLWTAWTDAERKQACLDFCTAFMLRPYLLQDGSVELRWFAPERNA